MHKMPEKLIAVKLAAFSVTALALGITLPDLAQAQESIGGLGVASSMSASMSGMSNSGVLTAGSRASGQARGMGSGSSSDFPDPSGFGGEGGMGSSSGMGSSGAMGSGGAAAVPPPPAQPRLIGPMRGSAIVSELLTGSSSIRPIPSPIGRSRSASGQANLSRRIKNMTPTQRKRLVMQKYDIRPRNWLAHYLKQDRYKMTSGLWGFVTTRTSRYYYRPWAVAMLKADSNHVIGFRTWQDALRAGYRPDPVSRPEPAAQVVELARYTRSEPLNVYVEFLYAGQISPTVFSRDYQYIKQVAGIVQSHKHTKHLVGSTVEKVILAALGRGPLPTSVGGPVYVPRPQTQFSGSPESSSSIGMSGSSSSGGEQRVDNFNNFSNRAGSMANVPANQGSSSSPSSSGSAPTGITN